jgi:hypothetical protein
VTQKKMKKDEEGEPEDEESEEEAWIWYLSSSICFRFFKWFYSVKIDNFPYLNVFMDPGLSTPTLTTVRSISIFILFF